MPTRCDDLQLDALVVVAYGLILPPAALARDRASAASISTPRSCRAGAAPRPSSARILAGDARRRRHDHAHGGGARHRPGARGRARRYRSRPTRRAALPIGWPGSAPTSCVKRVDALALGAAVEVPQPEAGVTYAEKISKAEALIDWREDASSCSHARPGVQSRAGRRDPLGRHAAAHLGGRARARDVRCGGGASERLGAMRGGAPGYGDRRFGRAASTWLAARGALRITRLQLAGRKPMAAGRIHQRTAARRRRFSSP